MHSLRKLFDLMPKLLVEWRSLSWPRRVVAGRGRGQLASCRVFQRHQAFGPSCCTAWHQHFRGPARQAPGPRRNRSREYRVTRAATARERQRARVAKSHDGLCRAMGDGRFQADAVSILLIAGRSIRLRNGCRRLVVPRRNVSRIGEFLDYMPPEPPVPGAVATGRTGFGIDSRLR